jgi:hypothetical protein
MQGCKSFFTKFSKVAYRYYPTEQGYYYGFHGLIVINSASMITTAAFTPANIDKRDVCSELVEKLMGLLLGDKGII